MSGCDAYTEALLADFIGGFPLNCTWEDGEVVVTLREPFDMLAETETAAARIEAGEDAKSSKSEIWLGDLDFEPRLTESESAVLPLNYPPTAA